MTRYPVYQGALCAAGAALKLVPNYISCLCNGVLLGESKTELLSVKSGTCHLPLLFSSGASWKQSFRPMSSVSHKAKAGLGPGVSESQGLWSSAVALSTSLSAATEDKNMQNAICQTHHSSHILYLYRNNLSA